MKTIGSKQQGSTKGGQTTKERYGTPFYREIGRRGGLTVLDERGVEFYEEIGHVGGRQTASLVAAGKNTTEGRRLTRKEKSAPRSIISRAAAALGSLGAKVVKERYGTPFYREIGRKGGEYLRDERGSAYFEEIGRRGGLKVQVLVAAGKRAAERKQRTVGSSVHVQA